MEQTVAQMGTLEQQINAIESANINRETLAAMEKAGEAMRQIHGKLTPQKVDETMYVSHIPPVSLTFPTRPRFADHLFTSCRDKLREENALSEEIVNAITGQTVGEPIDDMELEDELDALQQEQLDEQMSKTGNVPVADAVHKMPSVPVDPERKINDTTLSTEHALTFKIAVATKKKAIEDDEEAELEKLRAEMAM